MNMTGYYVVRTPDRQTATKLYNVLLDLGQDVKDSRLCAWVVRGDRYDDMSGVAFAGDNKYICYISEEQLRITHIPIISVEEFAAIVKVDIERVEI